MTNLMFDKEITALLVIANSISSAGNQTEALTNMQAAILLKKERKV